MKRGRPKIDDTPPPRQFTKVYSYDDGATETWHYNLDKFPNGPFKVDITAPVIKETWEEKNARQPKTLHKYFNPVNNKWVGYGRAKQLKLI